MSDNTKPGRLETDSLIEYTDPNTPSSVGKCILFVDREKGVVGIRALFGSDAVYQVPLADVARLVREAL